MRRIAGYPLWLGNVSDIRDLRALLDEGIEAVVDLAAGESPAQLPRELVYCRFPLVDGAGNSTWLLNSAVETVTSLLRASVPTLVYCGAGMSRTPAIAAAALARVGGMPMSATLAQVCSAGATDMSPTLWADLERLIGA
ncbi:MAG: dual specificity protein phosphatase family protein [Pirellulales bacterium]|nr:dual specificity protein phosphatase family protein [Pirellulales bacterium]